jgi:phosphoribosyl-AMP cyclohydrolase
MNGAASGAAAGLPSAPPPGWLDAIAFDERGLVPVVAQERTTREVLMLAWADRAALASTLESGLATYWSRSRAAPWRKGEQSGHLQHVHEILLDCDGDTVVYVVDQEGGIACHTGRANCFFRRLGDSGWKVFQPEPGGTQGNP